MSPEYINRGKLTDKADVFSFGILMIEVVTGRINHCQPENPVLHMVSFSSFKNSLAFMRA